MSIELKPCPFCGGEAHTFQTRWTNNRWYTCCPSCETICGLPDGYDFVGKYDTEAEAAEAWNIRAERTCFARPHYSTRLDTFGTAIGLECSECAYVLTQDPSGPILWRYCPNCGARVVDA